MWQVISIAGLITFLIRILPGLFNKTQKINEHPKFNKFLDYTICLVTGEIIFSIAFQGHINTEMPLALILISISTLIIAAILMWHTESMAKSYSTAITVFIVLYFLNHTFNG